ncbi:MAG: peptidoglycan-associated lipoprotein [Alphaproteobacteria bacterium]|nr:peptidoglycan-associated lipoprotein [Alphaproteobacteria bacterium]
MPFRFFLMIAAVLLVTACSGDGEEDMMVTSQTDTTTTMPGDYGDGTSVSGVTGTAVPGSQQDLVENVGDRVFFGYDSSDLTGEARSTLDRQASWLQQYPNLSITIEGHADERGTREYNLALGERRANAVRNYLTALGVPASRVSVISYGKERPVVFGSDTQSWAQNRRAVTVVN